MVSMDLRMARALLVALPETTPCSSVLALIWAETGCGKSERSGAWRPTTLRMALPRRRTTLAARATSLEERVLRDEGG
jgi:hypothetical protein